MNFNPKAHIKIYLTIQLFEPFAELHYISRRLKYHNVISNYRLDENGNSFIALNVNSQSFKFTELEQLEALEIAFPPQIKEEVNYRRTQIQQNEEKGARANNEKAFKQRPPNPNDQNYQPLQRPPVPHTQGPPHRPPGPHPQGPRHESPVLPAPGPQHRPSGQHAQDPQYRHQAPLAQGTQQRPPAPHTQDPL